jgi:hypothetical protein
MRPPLASWKNLPFPTPSRHSHLSLSSPSADVHALPVFFLTVASREHQGQRPLPPMACVEPPPTASATTTSSPCATPPQNSSRSSSSPCRHPLFLLSLPAPSPKQQAPAPPTSPMENNKPPRCPGVLAAQLGLASLLSGQPSRCSTPRTTCSTICATGCVWSCWCFAQRLRDDTDLRSAYELSSKPAVSSLLPRAFCVRLKGRTNK